MLQWIIKTSIPFTMAICICSLAFASGTDRRQMEITYENGQKQQVNMQQSARSLDRNNAAATCRTALPVLSVNIVSINIHCRSHQHRNGLLVL